MNKYDSIIFDVDGTIWDTTPVVVEAWNAALEICGLSYAHIKREDLMNLFGLPMDDIIRAILPNESDEVRAKFKPVCYEQEEIYVDREGGIIYEGLVETVKKLSEKYPVFVVSNCQSGYIELMLKGTGLTDYVTDFTCFGDTNKGKADNIRLIVEKHNLKNPIYVGDTHMDEEACNEAGVPFCFAAYGFGTSKNPVLVVNTPAEMLKVF